MASLKDVRVKISGVTKTKQITRAMNMVASAKLRGAQTRMENFSAYAGRFHEMLRSLAATGAELTHPLLVPHEAVKRVGIILATSDRGLCGGFNINLIGEAFRVAREKQAAGIEVVFFCAGKKGCDAVRKAGYTIARDFSGTMGNLSYPIADRIGLEAIDEYLKHELDEIILIYSKFVSLIRQVPTTEYLLPITPAQTEEESAKGTVEYIFEPSGDALMDVLLPRVVKALIYRGLLETSTSENAARMTAMDNATRNCNDLINALTRLYNKTRQAAITNELIDIVGGVEALKG